MFGPVPVPTMESRAEGALAHILGMTGILVCGLAGTSGAGLTRIPSEHLSEPSAEELSAERVVGELKEGLVRVMANILSSGTFLASSAASLSAALK